MNFRLYGYWRSSSAWRVRIGLAMKGIPYEYVALNLLEQEQFREEHRARNPMGQVPVLEVVEGPSPPEAPRSTGAGTGGSKVLRLVQSMAILHWLDERFPAPPLLPGDPDGRARVRALAEHVNSGIQPLQNAVVLRTLKEKLPGFEKEFARTFNARGLEALERAVADGAGRFCHGDAPGLADIYLVPQLYSARRFGLDVAAWPTLARIEAACAALPAFQAAHPDRQPDAVPPEKRSP
jgi:maleylpyruvate isomerase